MTYCLGIITHFGLVIAADSRTNAGVDYISTYQKLFDFSVPGQRVILLCTSGNLSTTQAILHTLRRNLKLVEGDTLHNQPTLFDTARYVGHKIRQVQDQDRPWLERDGIDYHCSCLLGGQIAGEEPALYLIYSQGNFVQATQETLFYRLVKLNTANLFSIAPSALKPH